MKNIFKLIVIFNITVNYSYDLDYLTKKYSKYFNNYTKFEIQTYIIFFIKKYKITDFSKVTEKQIEEFLKKGLKA